MEENNELINNPAVEYTDDNIRHLSDMEHVRTRPGMYIGKLGDGSHAEDGIYVLLKEIIDNSIDEFKMQAGKKIEIIIEENLRVSVRAAVPSCDPPNLPSPKMSRAPGIPSPC